MCCLHSLLWINNNKAFSNLFIIFVFMDKRTQGSRGYKQLGTFWTYTKYD